MIIINRPEDFNPKFEVSACYIQFNDKFLLLHRQDNKPYGNTWCLPAGKLDVNESPLDAVLREVFEETSISLDKSSLQFFKSLDVRYPEMDFIYHLFYTNLNSPIDVKLAFEEHKSYKWVTPKEALTLSLIPDEDFCIKLFYKHKI